LLHSSLVFHVFSCYIYLMSVTQTVEIPASHRLTIDVPPEVPAGRIILTYTPATDTGECPICAAHRDPVTGEERFNAETAAAIREGRAMMRGEITSKRFHSLAEMIEDLERDDPDD
jgi:hypothetical protein